MIRIFALALDLSETYFDDIVTFPGADGVFNYYPANKAPEVDASIDVGLGAHTDLQSFTLLLQDSVGGLQVLTHEGQWVKVPPLDHSFVVNIGDFLMRMSNDRFKSTVHRVFNRAPVERYSMPFFFGFNFNEKCGVLPSCTDDNNPPKYEPITCGEVGSPDSRAQHSITNVWIVVSDEVPTGEQKVILVKSVLCIQVQLARILSLFLVSSFIPQTESIIVSYGQVPLYKVRRGGESGLFG